MRRIAVFFALLVVFGVITSWAGAQVFHVWTFPFGVSKTEEQKNTHDIQFVQASQVSAPAMLQVVETAGVSAQAVFESVPVEASQPHVMQDPGPLQKPASRSIVPMVRPEAKAFPVVQPPADEIPDVVVPPIPKPVFVEPDERILAKPAISEEPFEKPADAMEQEERFWTEPVVITVNRAWQGMNRVSKDVTVVTQEELGRLPAKDLADALTLVPGVNISSRTKFGHFTPISIRGSASNNVLVMIDGIPFNTQASGQADILSALPTANVRQIEIVKGASAESWGSSLGGAINIITQDPASSDRFTFAAETTFSEFGTAKEALEFSGALGKMGYYLSGEHFESDGIRNVPGGVSKEGVAHKKFFGKLVFPLTDILKATSSFGVSDSEVNEGVFTSGLRIEVPYTTRYSQIHLDFDPHERYHVETAFKFNRQSIRTDSFFDSPALFLSTVDTKDTYYGVDIKSVSTFRERDTLVLGYDASTHLLKTSLMAKPRDILIQAPYANYTFSKGPIDLVAGVRYDSNEEFGDQANPGLGAVIHIPGIRDTLLRANVSRAFHSPPLLWKFFEDVAPGITANNPDIAPERAWVYEAGFETQAIPGVWSKLGFYRSDVTDAIKTAINSDGLFFKTNVDTVRQQGVELETRVLLFDDLELFFAGGFNDVEDRSTGETVRGRGVSRQSFRMGLNYVGTGGIETYLNARYDRWDSPAARQANDRKFIVDARLSKTFQDLVQGIDVTGFLNIYNLTNSKYWSSINFPLPQRHFEGGFSFDY